MSSQKNVLTKLSRNGKDKPLDDVVFNFIPPTEPKAPKSTVPAPRKPWDQLSPRGQRKRVHEAANCISKWIEEVYIQFIFTTYT